MQLTNSNKNRYEWRYSSFKSHTEKREIPIKMASPFHRCMTNLRWPLYFWYMIVNRGIQLNSKKSFASEALRLSPIWRRLCFYPYICIFYVFLGPLSFPNRHTANTSCELIRISQMTSPTEAKGHTRHFTNLIHILV